MLTVLGNHDWHVNRADEFAAVLEDAGVIVLDKRHNHRILEVVRHPGRDRGIKGFMGGFQGSHLPDFGEPLAARRLRASRSRRPRRWTRACARSRCARSGSCCCTTRPITETLEGERREIWTFLGTDRLAPPILEHNPDMVLHGHAHAGTFEGRARRGAGLQRVRARAGRGLLGLRARRRPAGRRQRCTRASRLLPRP